MIVQFVLVPKEAHGLVRTGTPRGIGAKHEEKLAALVDFFQHEVYLGLKEYIEGRE